MDCVAKLLLEDKGLDCSVIECEGVMLLRMVRVLREGWCCEEKRLRLRVQFNQMFVVRVGVVRR